MLTALFLMSLFGEGVLEIFSKADFRAVNRVVVDQERADAAVETMENMNARLAATMETRDQYFDDFNELDQQFDAPVEGYLTIVNQLRTARQEAYAEHILDIFALRDQLTREEWVAAFGDLAAQE